MNPPVRPDSRTLPAPTLRGFGLLELVIALLVIAVLLAFAIPSYRQYVSRAHRAEAVRNLLAAAECQERIRAESGYYDTSHCLSDLDNRHYAFRVEPADEPASLAFTVLAIPRRPDRCGNLALDQAGTRTVGADGANVADCWGGR